MYDVLDAIMERSSTRSYMDKKLSAEQIDRLVHAGLQAPTAANKQEIHITVVDGENPILSEINETKNEVLKLQNVSKNFYYDAPTVLILSGDQSFPWASLDAGIAVENIALAAEGLGLGSVIIGIIKIALLGEKKDYFAKALQFPTGYAFEIAIAVGYKAESKEPHEYDIEKNVTFI